MSKNLRTATFTLAARFLAARPVGPLVVKGNPLATRLALSAASNNRVVR